MMQPQHVSVLLKESIEALDIKPDGIYVDATFGRGGHSRLLLAQLGDKGRLYAMDRDPDAAKVAAEIKDERFIFIKKPFSAMDVALNDYKVSKVDGVLFDLGVSSPQLEQAARGFSFNKEGPLDMRMDSTSGITAKDWLNVVDENTLATVIRDLGGETHGLAKKIAKAILLALPKIETTLDLADAISSAMPKKLYKPNHHPATQTFQAIRMAVNDEVNEIKRGLEVATGVLKSNGILAVITFHGLEDALVKRFIRSKEGEELPAEIPSKERRVNQVLRLVNPVIKPSAQDIADNPRCRSARLRKAVKI